MPVAHLRGIELYYELHGEGSRVLSISGSGADLRTDPERGEGPLPSHHQVLMYDQRGLGQSSKPDGPYSMADYADDAVALLDHVGWDRCHVVGVSFGGMVAQHVALRHAARVDRLVLACTSAGGAGGSSFDLRALQGLSGDDLVNAWLPRLDTRVDTSVRPPRLPPGLEPILVGIRRMATAGGGASNADPDRAAGAALQLDARAGHDVWDELPRITAPTLVMAGRYDGQAPLVNSERLAQRIPDAALAVFEGGHAFLQQDPTAWPAMLEFLAGGTARHH
jgi:3-oxoadipate enol-lactonase